MININLFSEEKQHLDSTIIQYVNDNLKVMVEVYIDYLCMDDKIEIEEKLSDAFSREFIKFNKEKCKDFIYELYDILESHSMRNYIKPKYEFVLYHIMKWWIEVQDDEEDFIPIKLTNELEDKIRNNQFYKNEYGENFILNQLKDINCYFDFCFEDHDFLPDQLDCIVSLYINEPKLVEEFLHVNLDEYVELMSADLRELYNEKKNERKQEQKQEHNIEWSEELIIKELYNSFRLLSEYVIEIREKSEVEISNEIFRMNKILFKKYYKLELERESEIGHSRKKLGENDFYIYQNNDEYVNIAIGENKLLSGFSHAYGQVLGYLNPNFKFGFTISINKNKSIRDAYQYIIGELEKEKDRNKFDDFKIVDISESPFGEECKYLVRSTHIIPEDKERKMNLYHLILDLNDNYRRNVAIKARQSYRG